MSSNGSRSKKKIPYRNPGKAPVRSLRAGLATTAVLAALGVVAGSACAAPEGDGSATGAERAVRSERSVRSGAPRAVRVARFDQPVEVKAAPGFGRLSFVVEQPGRVMLLARGRKLSRPFLDLTRLVGYGGEQGLLSIAFPPDYGKSRKFYVYYTNRAGNIQIDEFRRRTARKAAPGSRRPVLTIPHPTYDNHNGGQMHFLGNLLYISTGDGGGGGDPDGNAQDRDSLLGKLLRIDPRRSNGRPYTVPAANPFVDGTGRSAIFAYGLRNPFRWSFDLRKRGEPRINIADVGESAWEEVNSLPLSDARGGNFGWSYFEGFDTHPGNGPQPVDPIEPVAALAHPGFSSVTGGLVVRDDRLPTLRGRYLFADFSRDRLLSLPGAPDRPTDPRQTSIEIPLVTSFGERADRTVLVTSLGGYLYRLVPGA